MGRSRNRPAHLAIRDKKVNEDCRINDVGKFPRWLSIADVIEARKWLPTSVRRTPTVPFALRYEDIDDERLFLKLENLQVTGAYKIRGAFNVLRSIPVEQRSKGIVLMSSGNFAQAFAYAGRLMSVPVIVVMLKESSPAKITGARALGAEVVLFDGPALDRQKQVEKIAVGRGMHAIDTWEEEAVIPGAGTLALEFLEDCPAVQQVLVPLSASGMGAAVGLVVKSLQPGARVIGVQPRYANAAYVSRLNGKPTAIDYWDTMADGLSARRPGELYFRYVERYVDDIVLIEESDIADAHMLLRLRAKVVAEPAGCVAAAAFLAGKVDQSLCTVAVVSGGNVTLDTMRRLENMSRFAKEA
jgi:threonine dehydratase